MKLINLKNEELLIDENTKEPIKIIYDEKKEKKNSLKIRIKSGVTASLVEVFKGSDLLVEFDRTFIIEDGANFKYIKYQDIDKNSIIDLNYNIELKDNATLEMVNFELGLGSNKNTYTSNLDFEDSRLNIYGLVKLDKQSDSKSIFNTTHNNAKTFSNIKYKHVLDGSSKATFEALSKVNEKAILSKVLQNSNTILLSDDAAIFARPHLEINIDELEASHGATTGTLDEEQLLYLQARGIEKPLATKMLLKAFENEIFDKIDDPKIEEFLENIKGGEYV